jgi:hypothetical protein
MNYNKKEEIITNEKLQEMKDKIDSLPYKEKLLKPLEAMEELRENIISLKNRNYTYHEIQKYLELECQLKYMTSELRILCEHGYDEFKENIIQKREKYRLRSVKKVRRFQEKQMRNCG